MSKKHYLRNALRHFDSNLAGVRRKSPRYVQLVERIRTSGKPMLTARAILRDLQHSVASARPDETPLDFSDLAELETAIVRKFGAILPEQEPRLRQLHKAVANGTLSHDALKFHADGLMAFWNPFKYSRKQELDAISGDAEEAHPIDDGFDL